jgi:hypothetical protein
MVMSTFVLAGAMLRYEKARRTIVSAHAEGARQPSLDDARNRSSLEAGTRFIPT